MASDPGPFFDGDVPAGIDWPNHPDAARHWREMDAEFHRASEHFEGLAVAFSRRPGIAALWADLALGIDEAWC